MSDQQNQSLAADPQGHSLSKRANERKRRAEEANGECWRCHGPLGEDWEEGHTVAKALGGKETKPECKLCNRKDGKRVTKIMAKIKRIRDKMLVKR